MNLKSQFVIFFLILSNFVFGQNPEISQLKTDHQTTPMGFDNPTPEFSWILQSKERSTIQTAFEIRIGDDQKKFETGTGNNWQTGKVSSNSTFGIKYHGKPLQSFTRYFWRVRISEIKSTNYFRVCTYF